MGPRPAIAVTVRSRAWARAIPGVAGLARRMAAAALAAAGVAPPVELSLVLADDALVRALNRDWRGKDHPTNVLAFANAAPLLGDVVLAYETCAAEATVQGKTLADHFAHLVVHGVLHLAGHDHGTAAEARLMERLECAVLAGRGIADPYRARPPARARRRPIRRAA